MLENVWGDLESSFEALVLVFIRNWDEGRREEGKWPGLLHAF
jgi:hypothetical protein